MSKHPLIRQGEGHNAYHRIHQERQLERERYLKLISQIQNDLINQPEKKGGARIDPRSSEGDQRRLRAIPVIAPSIPGTIPGTNPEQAIIVAEQKHLRTIR